MSRVSPSRRVRFWPNFFQSLAAVLAGNLLYFFLLAPHLPPPSQHGSFRLDLGLVIDFWICLVIYGVIQFFARRKYGKEPK